MAKNLKSLIADKIKQDGPISISEYMGLCLGHPEFGYYMTRDPFGADGDFTTAPEISQMFGEMIGAWCLQVWHDMGEPKSFNLIEMGPGRGTFMQDILRICGRKNDFLDACDIYLIETSPHLREVQKTRLSEYIIKWAYDFNDIKINTPSIIVSNELLDALPVHQFVRHQNHWHERAIGLNEQDDLIIVETSPSFDPRLMIDESLAQNGDIVELCPAAQHLIKDIADKIAEFGGAALFIDYGYTHSAPGDSIQAMKAHKFVDITHDPGECDITAHVNFERLLNVAKQSNVKCEDLVTQGEFLRNLGIELRADMLKKQNPEKSDEIISALNRMIGESDMGNLFKVFGFCHSDLNIAGFENVYI